MTPGEGNIAPAYGKNGRNSCYVSSIYLLLIMTYKITELVPFDVLSINKINYFKFQSPKELFAKGCAERNLFTVGVLRGNYSRGCLKEIIHKRGS